MTSSYIRTMTWLRSSLWLAVCLHLQGQTRVWHLMTQTADYISLAPADPRVIHAPFSLESLPPEAGPFQKRQLSTGPEPATLMSPLLDYCPLKLTASPRDYRTCL